MRIRSTALTGFVLSGLFATAVAAQDFDKLKQALGDIVAAEWIYEDIDAGYAEARKTGKPLLVSFR